MRYLMLFFVLLTLTGCIMAEDIEDVQPDIVEPEPEEQVQQLIDLQTNPQDNIGYPGEIYFFSVKIINRGLQNKYPINIKHELLDANNNLVADTEETLGLETMISKKSTVLIPKDFEPGACKILTTATYGDNNTAVSSFNMEVETPLKPQQLLPEPEENLTLGKIATVEIKNLEYIPKELNITKGTTVIWINRDDTSYSVNGAGFSSGVIGNNEKFSHQFNVSKNYRYGDTFHSNMWGTIYVD